MLYCSVDQYIFFSKSVVFRDRWGGDDIMQGIDVTGPPSLPKHFIVKKGCMGDILVGSDSEDDEDEEENEMNKGMIGDGDSDSDDVGEHGDN